MEIVDHTSEIAAIEPDRSVENLASTCLSIDAAVVVLRSTSESLNVLWSQTNRNLAERTLVLARDGYIASPSVTEALGGEFASGPLLEAAIRLRWLERPERGDPGQFVETGMGSGVLAAIKHCLNGDE